MTAFPPRLFRSALTPIRFEAAGVAALPSGAARPAAPAHGQALAAAIPRVDAAVTGLLMAGLSFGLLMALVGG